ncbi:hypothetical protein C8C85_1771 [Flavobacterium sp. 103]|uniref:hypothetical protein n=1 Tax=Flavobacterium sp. 103 TaxID=2135624 RepID=UPI000D5EA6A9|nr:hypothetical protein [Flavobacterium sp. 103]PVX45960.1 hypothetical protein C8C85_1771 [Flavobacterium sp. 103]
MQTLKQNRFFHKREFEILESKLSYKEIIPGKSNLEALIPFEDLSNNKASHENSNILFIIFSVFIYFLAFISFISRNDKDYDPDIWKFFSLIATVLLVIFLINKEKSWKIKIPKNNTAVFIYKKIPNEQVVNEFIENIFTSRDKYLRENYMYLDKNLSYENQYENLKWLWRVEAISKQEFDEKYQELKTMFNFDKKEIGFNKNVG